METPRSYIRFEDGTEEDIVYFEKDLNGDIMFSTKNGIYKAKKVPGVIVGMLSARETFEMLSARKTFEISKMTAGGDVRKVYYDRIRFDDRVKYEYDYNPRESEFEILAPKNASEEDILKLIAKDLKLTWKRV